jgi:hypothetical protein
MIVKPEGWLTAIERLWGGEEAPVLSLTMTLKLKGLPVAELGTPLMRPLVALSVNPGGREPALRIQLP